MLLIKSGNLHLSPWCHSFFVTVTSKIADHHHIYNNKENEILWNNDADIWSDEICWKTDPSTLAWYRVTTNVQFIKTTISEKCNKVTISKEINKTIKCAIKRGRPPCAQFLNTLPQR